MSDKNHSLNVAKRFLQTNEVPKSAKRLAAQYIFKDEQYGGSDDEELKQIVEEARKAFDAASGEWLWNETCLMFIRLPQETVSNITKGRLLVSFLIEDDEELKINGARMDVGGRFLPPISVHVPAQVLARCKCDYVFVMVTKHDNLIVFGQNLDPETHHQSVDVRYYKHDGTPHREI